MAYDMQVVATAYATARGMGATPKVMLALFEAGIVESGFRNLDHGDRDSVGFLQQRPSMGWPNPTDVPTATRSFVSRATPIQNNYATSGQLAQAVQRSAFPLKYDAVQAEAARLLATAGGTPSSLADTTQTALGDSSVLKNLNLLFELVTSLSFWQRMGFWMVGGIAVGIAVWRMSQ